MEKMNRRNFIGSTAKAVAGTYAFSQLSFLLQSFKPLADLPFGFQTWTVKEMLSKDMSGTFKLMADMGYRYTEMCSPKGYANIGFGSFVNLKPGEIKKVINDAGLECPSCHFGFGEFAPEKIDEGIEFAKGLGLSQMVCSTFWLPKTATISDYHAAADKLNKAAEKIKAAGMQTAFHNHDFEFVMLEGQLIYDALLARFDPSLVKMQFQTQVIVHGYKAVDYFKKYSGRFISAHLSDWTTDKKEAALGKGVIDWKEFFAEAKTVGVENFFVEMNFDKFKDSAAFIKGM